MRSPDSLRTIEERCTLFKGSHGRRTMKTRMLSSLAIAALATVTLNSTEALAKSGGGGGSSGARSFSAVRTSPVVIKQVKTVTTTSAVKKLNTTGKLDPKVVTGKLDPSKLDPSKVVTFPGKLEPGKLDPGKVITFPPGKIVDPLPPKDPPAPPAPPAPPVVVKPPIVFPAVSVGVAAPVAVEPAGCVFERSVRKLPDGGLQRVLIKVCPDVVVQ